MSKDFVSTYPLRDRASTQRRFDSNFTAAAAKFAQKPKYGERKLHTPPTVKANASTTNPRGVGVGELTSPTPSSTSSSSRTLSENTNALNSPQTVPETVSVNMGTLEMVIEKVIARHLSGQKAWVIEKIDQMGKTNQSVVSQTMADMEERISDCVLKKMQSELDDMRSVISQAPPPQSQFWELQTPSSARPSDFSLGRSSPSPSSSISNLGKKPANPAAIWSIPRHHVIGDNSAAVAKAGAPVDANGGGDDGGQLPKQQQQ
ncbi:hypothetical protein HK102_013845, partial [Quaeritorhiza haematococci]